MVQIVGYSLRNPKEGKAYVALEIEGDIEMVQSQKTGRFYATVRRCTISSTFDEMTAARMCGKQMPGSIERVPSEPYDYIIRDTGEVVKMGYRWEYQPEGSRRTFAPKAKTENLATPENVVKDTEMILENA